MTERDRVVDLLRGASLAVVVAGHVLMAVVTWTDGMPRVDNILALIPSLRIATWGLQVMPLFFAAGAVANRLGFQSASARGEPWRVWMWGRVRRLVRPVIPYLAIWIPLVLLLGAFLPRASAPLARLSTQLLWFLGVYLLVIATTPWQLRLAKVGLPAVLALVTIAALVDVARFGGVAPVGLLNFLVVWFAAATLGLVVRDCKPQHRGRLWIVAATAALVNVALVRLGPYPLSMVGLPDAPVSNVAPPTLALALHAVMLIAVAGASWPALERACARPRVWRATQRLGAVAMTLYLWHLTVLIVVIIAEHLAGVERPPLPDWRFWPATALHLAVVALLVVPVVRLMSPLEHTAIPWLDRERRAPPASLVSHAAAVAGVVVLSIAFLVLSATGMDGFPFARTVHYAGLPLTPGLGFLLLVAGTLLSRVGGRATKSEHILR